MRRWLIVFLCCTLAFQAWAAAWPGGMRPCPPEMQAAMQQATVAEEAGEDDCCNDLATALRTGKLCKGMADCHLATAWLLPETGATAAPPPVAAALPACPDAAPPAAPRDAIWRPPTSH